MTTKTDLESLAALCDEAADAAVDRLIGLGPRPADAHGAATWDAQDALLKNKISTLNNLSSSLSALIVQQALEQVWPALDALGEVTASAQASIARIREIAKTMATIASVINLGVAAVTLATQPTAGNATGLVSAFKNLEASL